VRFFDSHAHLDSLSPEALEGVLGRAQEIGLTDIVCIGASDGIESNHRTMAVVRQNRRLHATLGIHPHDVARISESAFLELETLAQDPSVVAIGETGLDYFYEHAPKEAQVSAFRRFLGIARRLNLPVVIHTRDAEDDTIRILREEKAERIGGVIHCFTGTQALANACLDLGFYISFSGILTFRNAEAIREVARNNPRDRTLIETDCPYLAPVPLRGKSNEPSYIVHTAKCLAELWSVDEDEVKQVTGANAARLFKR
jgi:TatD DNase family protein